MAKVENGQITETKTEARAADGHMEPFHALLWGGVGVIVLFVVIYVAFFSH